MGESDKQAGPDINVYSFMKLVLFLLSGLLLLVTTWTNIGDYTTLVSSPIVYNCSIALTFYGKLPDSCEAGNRRNLAVKYSISIITILIFLLIVVNKIPEYFVILIIGKVLFSCMPVLPSWLAIKDYSEDNKKTNIASKRTKKQLEDKKRNEEKAKKEKAQKDKGESRIQLKEVAIKYDEKNKNR